MSRKIVLLTQGHSNPHTAKTACSLLRYRSSEVVAVLDGTQSGITANQLLGVGGDIPVIASLDETGDANTLIIGIAPPGGKIPAEWRPVVRQALQRKMNVVSGLHDFLSDDPEFARHANQSGATITDVRKNRFKTIARCEGINESCLRIHTVGHDCSVGKMVTSIEITNGLKRRGKDAKFAATGQTGIMVEGEGYPIDCVAADFISGAAEQLILENQHHEIVLVEGQGSLIHPSYSAVTLGILHGARPHGLVFCYEVGRDVVTGVEQMTIPPLMAIRRVYETMANAMHPCKVIGVAMNSRRVSAEEAEIERERVQKEFGLPVCDIFRHGPDDLVDAVLSLQAELKS